MPDAQSHDNDEKHSRQRGLEQTASPEHQFDNQQPYGDNAPLSRSLLGADSLASRSNSVVRASTIQQMQGTHGNRAVQRFLQHQPVSVQRDDNMPWYQRAMHGVSDTVSSAANSVSHSDAANWVRNSASTIAAHPMDALGSVATAVADPLSAIAHGANSVFGRDQTPPPQAHGQAPSHDHSAFERGLTWAEGQASHAVHGAANMVSGVPGLSSFAQSAAGTTDQLLQVPTGIMRAGGTMIGGIAGMVANPMQAAAGMERMAENLGPPGFLNPFRTAHAAYDVATGTGDLSERVSGAAHNWLDPMEAMRQSGQFSANMIAGEEDKVSHERHGGMIEGYREDYEQGRYMSMLGRGMGDAAMMLMGGGEVGAGGRAVEAASLAPRAMEMSAQVARGSEALVGGIERGATSGIEGASDAARGMTPQPVRQMPAVPVDVAPNAPQPGRWNAGPVGTPPVSSPVMEMPAVNPAEAASGRMPRDWGTYSVGRGRLPGEVGEMPVVGANPGLREPAGFGSNAGRISPRSSAPITGVPSVSDIDPLARTAEMPRVEMPRAVDPFAPTGQMPSHVDPLAPTGQMPTHTPTLPGIGPGGGRQTLPGIGPAELPHSVDPYAPTIPSIPVDPHAPTLPSIRQPPGRPTIPGIGLGGSRQTLPGIGAGEIPHPIDPLAPIGETPGQAPVEPVLNPGDHPLRGVDADQSWFSDALRELRSEWKGDNNLASRDLMRRMIEGHGFDFDKAVDFRNPQYVPRD